MKKKIISLLLMLVLLVSVAACGGPKEEAAKTEAAKETEAPADGGEEAAKDKVRIGILVWKFEDTYNSTVRSAMEKYAKELGDAAGVEVELDMQDGKDDQAIQNDQATVMLATEPDVMVVNLCDVAAGQSIIDMIAPHGLKTIFYNKEPVDPTVMTNYEPGSIFIGTDIAQAGVMQGDILAKLVEEHPEYDRNGDGVIQYLMFQGEPNNPEAIARTEYSVKQAEENGLKMELLNGEVIVANWDTSKAQDAMNATFANLGDKIEAVFCNNDDMALGVIAALNSNGYNMGEDDKFIPVIGVDATDAALEALNNGTLAGTVKQDGDAMGKAVIATALNAALGKDFLDGTDYQIADDGYSIRIEYQIIQ